MLRGPFLDAARRLDDPKADAAVRAASGCHIVLPGYFTPGGMGFANLRTARGATMYFLPWQGHTIVGSTDKARAPPAPSRRRVSTRARMDISCVPPVAREASPPNARAIYRRFHPREAESRGAHGAVLHTDGGLPPFASTRVTTLNARLALFA